MIIHVMGGGVNRIAHVNGCFLGFLAGFPSGMASGESCGVSPPIQNEVLYGVQTLLELRIKAQ
jgi:hypothetical protein